jgi:tryptophan synthase alpha chain
VLPLGGQRSGEPRKRGGTTLNRIDATFTSLKAAGRTALIPYVTAGDPSLAAMPALLDALTAAGADVIELGVPFSDPMADGPVIQRASERALAQHVGLADVLALVRDFRQSNRSTPIVLMGYANPIEAMDETVFADRAAEAGVDGVLVVDYPPEEAREFALLLRARDIAPIFLLSPTTPEARIAAVASLARGFVYYVSLKGVTGAGHLDTTDVARKLLEIRRHVRLPVGVGFGIRDATGATAIAAHADAVVIGSRIIEEIEQGPPATAAARAGRWLAGIRGALDAMERKRAA